MEELKKSVKHVKGVGPKTALLLNRLSIFTIEDLLTYYPKMYEDRTNIKPIHSLSDGETAAVTGKIELIDRDRYTKQGKHITRIIIKDDTGFVVAVWYNQKFIKNSFKINEKYLFYGKISRLFGETQITSPQFEKIDEDIFNSIVPVYGVTKGLYQKTIRNIMDNLISDKNFYVDDIIPGNIREELKLCDISCAIKNIHFPEEAKKLNYAEKRIKFEELLILQLGLMMERYRIDYENKGIRFDVSPDLKNFVKGLPFVLTNSQKNVLKEILSDMKSNKQMNRLIQGDVGSGKTIIAAIALLNTVKNDYQGVLMAPTEILAYQHYMSMQSFFKDYGIKICLLSGKVSKKEKAKILEDIENGRVHIVIGTHAIIQDNVLFNNLGLVITDEQHRFGVRQRAVLSKKGENPDILIMTATPIPRTMALFIYGDLDISLINEMPSGRQKINTYRAEISMRQRVYNFIRKEVENGRQAYVVCPLIEESEVLDLESAVELVKKLQTEYLKDLSIGLLHGKMKPTEKDEMMEKFNNGEIKVLVSTTVVEVGINVPNATVMVIENADRFGLSTLHQLRGRVGRGEHKSYCILVCDSKSDISKKRMQIMQQIHDGFKIAEEDLKLRGTGEFFGTRQHGLPDLKLANIITDVEILKCANQLAKQLVLSGKINDDEFKLLRMKVQSKFNNQSDIIILN